MSLNAIVAAVSLAAVALAIPAPPATMFDPSALSTVHDEPDLMTLILSFVVSPTVVTSVYTTDFVFGAYLMAF